MKYKQHQREKHQEPNRNVVQPPAKTTKAVMVIVEVERYALKIGLHVVVDQQASWERRVDRNRSIDAMHDAQVIVMRQ